MKWQNWQKVARTGRKWQELAEIGRHWETLTDISKTPDCRVSSALRYLSQTKNNATPSCRIRATGHSRAPQQNQDWATEITLKSLYHLLARTVKLKSRDWDKSFEGWVQPQRPSQPREPPSSLQTTRGRKKLLTPDTHRKRPKWEEQKKLLSEVLLSNILAS